MAEACLPLTEPTSSHLEKVAKRPYFAVLLLILVGWLPAALVLPPLDRDESRFAEASRQMVESGNYIDIRFAQAARYKKPIGIYWLQATAAKVLGPRSESGIVTYRLPSLVGGFLSLLLLFGLARSIAPPQTALLASLLLGSTLLLAAESDIATTDAALLACVTAVEAVLMRVYLFARGNKRPPTVLLFGGWIALAFGILLKGPVIVAVAGVSVLAISVWDRDWRWLKATRPLGGVIVAALVVAPWAIAIGFASHGAFYQQSLGQDFGAKILGGAESHGAPPGYYLALVTLTFWPAILFLLPALGFAVSNRSDPVLRYLLAWSGGTWLLFELVPTKLPHYVLPAFPALALLAALWTTRQQPPKSERLTRILSVVSSVQFALGALALAAAIVLLPRYLGGTMAWPVVAGATLVLVMALAAVVLFLRGSPTSAAATAVVSAMAFDVLLALGLAPRLPALWLSPRAAELVSSHRRAGDPPVVLDGYVEPSLVFLLGAQTRLEPPPVAGAYSGHAGGLALVEDRDRDLFLSELRKEGAAAAAEGRVSGLDYSTGRSQHLTLYRVTPASPKPSRS